MVQVRGIMGQVYLKFNDPLSNSRTLKKEHLNGELSTTRLSVKSMDMRPMYDPSNYLLKLYHMRCVCMTSRIYFSKRCFPTCTATALHGIKVTLSPATHPIIRTRPLRDTGHWDLWMVKCQHIVVTIGQGTCFNRTPIKLEERPRRKLITRHPERT
jgi:hypothetical protein